jgi:putative membrane protein
MIGAAIGAIAFAVAAGFQPAAYSKQTNNQTAQNSQMSSPARSSSQNSAKTSNQQFVTQATQANLAEIQLGQLAIQKSSNSQVKQYAQMLIQDHTQANSQLKQLASSKSLSVPTQPNAQQRAAKARLSGLSGQAFDRAYIQQMEQDHTKSVALFQKESQQGQDPDLKNLAATLLPKLQSHEQEAQQIAGRIGVGNQSRSK